MSHNPHAPVPDDFHLPGHEVLAIAGQDALAFAQSQFMNDVAALGDGQWQWNGWLTPKGRVIVLFALLRLDTHTLWLLLPDAAARTVAAQLQRFVFRSKLSLEARPDLLASGRFGPPKRASGGTLATDADGTELDFGGKGGPRTLRIQPVPAVENDACAAEWRRFDLQHGLPRLRGDQADAWTPQQLSLDRLGAFSVKKGCYPGQEIVARTHFLGHVKRGLALFDASGPVQEGAAIAAGGRTIGSVACVQDRVVLAVMPLDAQGLVLDAGGVALATAPLQDGLAR